MVSCRRYAPLQLPVSAGRETHPGVLKIRQCRFESDWGHHIAGQLVQLRRVEMRTVAGPSRVVQWALSGGPYTVSSGIAGGADVIRMLAIPSLGPLLSVLRSPQGAQIVLTRGPSRENEYPVAQADEIP
jgi:hypothetical protein